ncbi:hypothetical protein A4X09_0g3409 [Tilletia walkeri]|uniref:SP-RING-type domain-containing protein n=1 Tax=Tilletia walkeri TaxID=117179 RepID=A0A8X7T5L1_9BASI|nr:hypothetical protein A4X09_0g3409 [Tilletia walkeri]
MATPSGSAPGSSSAGAAGSAVFIQYNAVITLLRLLTVNNLKNVIKDLQQGSFRLYHMNTTGKKAELQERITKEIDNAKADNNVHLFTHIYDVIKRNSGRPGWGQALEASRVIGPGNTLGGTPGSSPAAGSSANGAGGYRYGYPGSIGAGSSAGGSAAGIPNSKMTGPGIWPGYPGNASASASGSGAAGARASSGRPTFRPSPFFDMKQHVSTMGLCPDAGPNERKNVILHFTLSNEVQQLLQSSKHQVRLFCTNLEAYNASMHYQNRPAPIIFPLTCEARVNDRLLTANLKGNRKVPGKVPPPDLNRDKALHLDGKTNKVELSYVNTTYQKYAMICVVVEVHSIDSLVAKVKERPLTVEMVVNSILRLQQDDEIEAGAAKMTLRCPLSAMRIKVPSRSKKCSHRQCFDADTFFQLNEQTPSWNCPVCNNGINADDLILDQFVEDILKQVPEDQDAIVVEPDASWHTEDGKFRSKGAPETNGAGAVNGKGKETEVRKPAPDIIVMDMTPSPPPTPAHARPASSGAPSSTANSNSAGGPYSIPSSSGSSVQAAPAPRRSNPIIIDLTLSSDEDDVPLRTLPVRRPAQSPAVGTQQGRAQASAGPSANAGRDPVPGLAPGSLGRLNASSSASPSPFASASAPGRPDSHARGESADGDSSMASDNAPPAPGRPLGRLLPRRARESDADQGGDDEDDDNVVLSPDRRRVRRRIESPVDEDEVDRSLRDQSDPRWRRSDASGQGSRSGRSSRATNYNEFDDDEDDQPLLPHRNRLGSSVSGARAGEADKSASSASRSSNAFGAGASTASGERSSMQDSRSSDSLRGQAIRGTGSSSTDYRSALSASTSGAPSGFRSSTTGSSWRPVGTNATARDQEDRERDRGWERDRDRDYRGQSSGSQRNSWRGGANASSTSLPELLPSATTFASYAGGSSLPSRVGGGALPRQSGGGSAPASHGSESAILNGPNGSRWTGWSAPHDAGRPKSSLETHGASSGPVQGSRAPSPDKSGAGLNSGGRATLPPKPVHAPGGVWDSTFGPRNGTS